MGLFGKSSKPNVKKLKEEQDVEGLIKALEHKDKDVREDAVQALKSLGTDRAKEAIKEYEARRLEKAQILTEKGIALVQQLKFKDALRCFDEAMEHDPQSAETWYWKGYAISMETRDDKAALKALNKALELDPDYIRAQKHKASLLGLSYSEQLECYERVLAIDPLDPDGWTGKGRVLMGMQRYDEGILCCKKATELAPFDAMAWWGLASGLENVGRVGEAIQAYELFIELATEQDTTPSDTPMEDAGQQIRKTGILFARKRIAELRTGNQNSTV